MREDKIEQGITFVKNMQKDKNVTSVEEQKKFLKDKLTEDEISEVFKRIQEKDGKNAIETAGDVTKNSPNAQARLQQTSSHFPVTA